MANIQIGKIKFIGKTVNVARGDKPFLKRELVLDASRYDEFTGEKRENYVTMQFTQKRCDELDGFQVGELVEVSFILSGRAYQKDGQTKYITDIVGYKVERRGNAQPQAQVAAPQAPSPQAPFPQAPQQEQELKEEMPF